MLAAPRKERSAAWNGSSKEIQGPKWLRKKGLFYLKNPQTNKKLSTFVCSTGETKLGIVSVLLTFMLPEVFRKVSKHIKKSPKPTKQPESCFLVKG